MSKPYWIIALESSKIRQTPAQHETTGSASSGVDTPNAPLALGVLLFAPKPACICASDTNRKRAQRGEFPLCEDMPWKCPRDVPPTCNTGVHTPISKKAQSYPSPGQQTLF